ncbi:MAG TPA: hypothetical protein VGG39_13255 [Polyangiaceae bacterium]|jgi:hypothetical protein
MSPDSKSPKQDSQEPGPPSGTTARLSGRAPSAWGATRDALAALRNLDALLRSGSVLYRTILDLLPELRTSATVLRDLFERAQSTEGAPREVGDHGVARVTELTELLEATAQADGERDELAARTRRLADELEAVADLLALLERAADPAPTEVSVDRLVREAVRLSPGAGRGRELVLRFDEAAPDCAVDADPSVVGTLLSLLAGSIDGGAPGVVLRARCSRDEAVFAFEPATAADACFPAFSVRVPAQVPPTAAVVVAVAAQIGASLERDRGRASLRMRCAPG